MGREMHPELRFTGKQLLLNLNAIYKLLEVNGNNSTKFKNDPIKMDRIQEVLRRQ